MMRLAGRDDSGRMLEYLLRQPKRDLYAVFITRVLATRHRGLVDRPSQHHTNPLVVAISPGVRS
jgi:hypothetical protein